jgi:hypothetical protein
MLSNERIAGTVRLRNQRSTYYCGWLLFFAQGFFAQRQQRFFHKAFKKVNLYPL